MLFQISVIVFLSASKAFPQSSYPQIKVNQSLFYFGLTTQLELSTHLNGQQNELHSLLTTTYTWTSGLGVQILLPITWIDKAPIVPNTQAPRIGFNRVERISLRGNYRLIGDTLDYFALGTGIGLPYQSSQAMSQTGFDSWQLYATLIARKDWQWIALLAQISDSPTIPNSKPKSSEINLYSDPSDQIQFNLYILTYPTEKLSPYLLFSETFPISGYTGETRNQINFITGESKIGRSRTLGLGMNWTPDPAILAGTEMDYLFESPFPGTVSLSWMVNVKWLF